MRDLLDRYKEDKMAVINEKKSALKFCDASAGYVMTTPTNLNKLCKGECAIANKGGDGLVTLKDIASGNEPVLKTIVGNTYNWLDSHGDVHVKNCFKNSIENDMTPLHLHDHEFKVLAQVGDVQKVWEQKIAWRTLGIDKDGFTQALLINSNVKKEYNPSFYQMYKDGNINQHSVGMQYVDLQLAVNSEDKYFAEEKATWEEYYDTIANKDAVTNHFWVVKEAKLIEVSAVARGSNILTPTIKQVDLEEKIDIESIRKTLSFL